MKFLPLIFAAVVYVCYGVVHPEWFNYHEQYQLFMFGWDYLSEHLSYASGVSVYLSEFLVQFYFLPYVGAAIWAGLLVLMGYLVWKVAQGLGGDESHYPLSYLPSMLLAIYCGDQYVMMALPVAIILALGFALLYNKMTDSRRVYLQLGVIPIVYWIAGYGVFVYVALALLADRRKFGYRIDKTLIFTGIYVLEVLLTIIIVGYTVMRQYPFIDIICGVNYYRERLVVPMMQHIVALSVVMVPVVIAKLKGVGKAVSIVEAAVVSLALPLLLPISHYKDTYSLLRIDYLVRNQEWDEVIKYCEKHQPYNDMACTGLNLALAMTNQLPERMFEFKQYGQNGLLSVFARDMVSCGITAEACYYLGLINSVLRYNYDSQAAIVNCNMSGRFTRRIAEAYLLDGNYELARKYAGMLRKTFYYRQWALRVESCCDNPSQIAERKRWALISRYRLPENQLFSVTDMDEMLMNLYKHCTDNRLALQYSLACDLLNAKMQNFVMAMSQTQDDKARIPRAYQEALAYVYLRNIGSIDKMPDFISPEVKADLKEFDRLYMLDRNSPLLHQGRLAKTYWHYIVFGNN